ncbi:MAG: TetR/AcrR family transcriptional regulator [Acidimicrobiales bacterium]|nr:TetR/AcrR family transcriptional regulator [Acidimicrobiales bacterium]MDG1875785.1 TetR/AcrR family transcriptional regulator [Acidimicrobiales bacterium]
MTVVEGMAIDQYGARQRILDSTAELVIEHGVAGVAQRQIADRVGIRAASLYHHFASKNEIVEAVFRRGIDVMEGAWDEAADATHGADPYPRLAAHIRAHLSALFDHGPYTAAHVSAFRTAPAAVRDAVVPMRDAYEARWTGLLGELAADGELANGTPIGLSRLALFGAMNTTVEWFDADRGNLDELAEVITRQFWNGVAA